MGLGEECLKANPDIKCITPDYCFVSYMDEEFVAENLTLMYAQAVNKIGKETLNVKFKTMPAISAVSVIVKGGYSENLPLAYAYATKWVQEHGYEVTDRARECYIDGIWNKDNPDDYITEIQLPVCKK